MKMLKTMLNSLALVGLFAPVALAGYGCRVGGGGAKIALLLVAVAAGYWVLTLAIKQKDPLRKVGKFLGWLIIVVSIAGMLCSAAYRACKYKCSKKGVACGVSADKKASACTYHLKK